MRVPEFSDAADLLKVGGALTLAACAGHRPIEPIVHNAGTPMELMETTLPGADRTTLSVCLDPAKWQGDVFTAQSVAELKAIAAAVRTVCTGSVELPQVGSKFTFNGTVDPGDFPARVYVDGAGNACSEVSFLKTQACPGAFEVQKYSQEL